MDFTDIAKVKRQIQLWEDTLRWIEDNPEAYARFKELALQKVLLGERFSIGALTEVVRWDASVRFKRKDFKILNGYRRYIAIKLMQDMPEVEAYITTKRGSSLPSNIAARLGMPDDKSIPDDIFDMGVSARDDEDDVDEDDEVNPFDRIPFVDEDLKAHGEPVVPPDAEDLSFDDLF